MAEERLPCPSKHTIDFKISLNELHFRGKKNRKKLQETCWFLGCKFIAAPNLSLFFYLRTLHHLNSPTVTIKRKPYLRCIERMS